MTESSRDGIEVDSGVEELGSGVVAEFPERARDALPCGHSDGVYGVGVPRRAAVRSGRTRSRLAGRRQQVRGRMTASAEPVGEHLARQRVEGYPPAVAIPGTLLDVLPRS